MITSETLANFDLFQGLGDDALHAIAGACQEASFAAEVNILAMGHPTRYVYLLQAGSVRLVLPTPQAEPTIVAVLNSPGQAFGWSTLFGSGHCTATAQAVTDVQAIAVDGSRLLDYLTQQPAKGFVIAKRIVQIMRQRLSITRRLLLETLCCYEIEQNLISYPPPSNRQHQ
jgi:CRP-like cAMP-binding protein